jgi:hypothetical protein
MKQLTVSDELHQSIKQRAIRDGRMIRAEVAIAMRKLLGAKFPKDCPEHELLPEHLR